MTTTITKVLIANRGEIAVRVARTCRRLGLGTVAVFSDPDADALHVAACDEAVRLGGATSQESYLRIDALIDAARRTGADAVHPGYGFLAENAAFARAVEDAGLTWIGPGPDAIAAMGDKLEAKRVMADAGVPLLPSVALGAEPSAGELEEASSAVGFPCMVKAAAGGGGKGMRVVHDRDDLAEEVAAAQREATSAFGDGRVFLERFVERPRHIEVQVLADTHGTVLHLFERECSIQRRHQKVVEESPSPVLDPATREEMGKAAVAAAAAIGYVNAGTVEFIAESDPDTQQVTGFHFLEMNTRLQVEHPVTELVTGLDLVRLQLLVAMGERLPVAQEELRQQGHAIEARLYAEDPANGFLPATGTLHAFVPGEVEGVRWDAGVRSGSEVSTYYDPMLAKVIAHGGTRAEAAARLARALERSVIHGVTTNRDLLVNVLRDGAFLAGDTTTAFFAERFPTDEARTFTPDESLIRQAVLATTLVAQAERAQRSGPLRGIRSGFTNDPFARWQVSYTIAHQQHPVAYRSQRDGSVRLWLGDQEHHGRLVGDGVVEIDGHRVPVHRSVRGHEHALLLPGGAVVLREVPRFPEARHEDVPGATFAPMPGAVATVAVEEGQQVARGELMVALEAMKMEHRITAPFDGTVAEVRVSEGQQVDADEVLVVVAPSEDAEEDASA